MLDDEALEALDTFEFEPSGFSGFRVLEVWGFNRFW